MIEKYLYDRYEYNLIGISIEESDKPGFAIIRATVSPQLVQGNKSYIPFYEPPPVILDLLFPLEEKIRPNFRIMDADLNEQIDAWQKKMHGET